MQGITATHKLCIKCDVVKDIESFSTDNTRDDGKHPYCKDCKRVGDTAHRREMRQTNEVIRLRDNEASRRNYQKFREERIAKMPTRDPIYNKNSFLKSTYGITLAEYEALLESQNGVCAICGGKEKRKSRYGGVCRLHVDHDHKSGKVRGLLCQQCNNGIGHFRENTAILAKAIIYVNKHSI